jgi:hypothetical protein
MHKKNLHHYIITLLTFTCLSINAFADEIQLKENHPYQHVVVKGDTLWDISATFLKDPWLWPKVWRMNRAQIKNPHLIYPGDVVVLDTSGENPQLRLLNETVTLDPTAKIEALEKEAIKTISPNVVMPFLNQPLLIENDQLETSPRIIAGQDNRVIFSPGSRVYVNNIKEEEGQHWNIYRAGDKFIDPDTKEVLGTEAIYLGDLGVTRFGEPASADIITAKEEILVKDRLVPAPDEFQSSFVPHAPENEVMGRILRIHGGVAGSVAEAGPNAVVSVNLGEKDGLEAGHVLAISRYGRVIQDPEYKKNDAKSESSNNAESSLKPGQVKLPDERVGLLMIFRTFDRVSYGLIMNTSGSVYTLDSVHTP